MRARGHVSSDIEKILSKKHLTIDQRFKQAFARLYNTPGTIFGMLSGPLLARYLFEKAISCKPERPGRYS